MHSVEYCWHQLVNMKAQSQLQVACRALIIEKPSKRIRVIKSAKKDSKAGKHRIKTRESRKS